MRVQNVDTKSFLENLEVVGNAVASKSPMPCLTGVLINANENKITLLGSDSNTAIKKVVFAKETDNTIFEIIENGVALVEYKMLKAILSKLESPTTEFYTENNQFIIKNGKSVYKLNMNNHDDYPKVEFKKLDNEIEIKTEDLKGIISKVSFSCATNEKRPILTGVNFDCQNNVLNCVATDSYRLSKYTLKFDNEINDTNFTFPRQSLIALEKIIVKTKQEYIKLLYGNNNEVVVNVDNTLYKTRLLDGIYPDTNKLLGNSYDYVVKINRTLLANAIDRISIFTSSENSCIVKLNFAKDNSLLIKSNDTQFGNAREILECNQANPFDLEIACSANFLVEALNSFEGDYVFINMQGTVKPFVINEEFNDKVTQLLLPVKVQ